MKSRCLALDSATSIHCIIFLCVLFFHQERASAEHIYVYGAVSILVPVLVLQVASNSMICGYVTCEVMDRGDATDASF